MLQILDVQQAARIQMFISGVLPDMIVICGMLLRRMEHHRPRRLQLPATQRTHSQESSSRALQTNACNQAEQAGSQAHTDAAARHTQKNAEPAASHADTEAAHAATRHVEAQVCAILPWSCSTFWPESLAELVCYHLVYLQSERSLGVKHACADMLGANHGLVSCVTS